MPASSVSLAQPRMAVFDHAVNEADAFVGLGAVGVDEEAELADALTILPFATRQMKNARIVS